MDKYQTLLNTIRTEIGKGEIIIKKTMKRTPEGKQLLEELKLSKEKRTLMTTEDTDSWAHFYIQMDKMNLEGITEIQVTTKTFRTLYLTNHGEDTVEFRGIPITANIELDKTKEILNLNTPRLESINSLDGKAIFAHHCVYTMASQTCYKCGQSRTPSVDSPKHGKNND